MDLIWGAFSSIMKGKLSLYISGYQAIFHDSNIEHAISFVWSNNLT